MSIGFCKYCHQGINVDANPGATEEELNQLATSICECPGATHEAWMNMVLEEFDQNLEVLFGKKPKLKKLLWAAGEMIMAGQMKKLSVTESQGKTIALAIKDKGLCVTITNKTKEETISYG